jgi:hypothetical protein
MGRGDATRGKRLDVLRRIGWRRPKSSTAWVSPSTSPRDTQESKARVGSRWTSWAPRPALPLVAAAPPLATQVTACRGLPLPKCVPIAAGSLKPVLSSQPKRSVWSGVGRREKSRNHKFSLTPPPRPRSPRPRLALLATLISVGTVAFLLFSPAALASPCPNEQLRAENHSTQLPDCRAYELVTPPFKAGAFVRPVAITLTGGEVIASSYGAVNGVGGSTGNGQGGTIAQGAVYDLSRGSEGWSTAPVAPEAAEYQNPMELFDARGSSTGAPEAVWGLDPAGAAPNVTALYLRRAGGEVARIGPATPDPTLENAKNAYAYAGSSSANLEHTLFTINLPEFRWPFDSTVGVGGLTQEIGGDSLYEYVGTGNARPALVGVKGTSRESTDLVSECGTLLGSSAPVIGAVGSTYNAISATGRRIFFTAVGTDQSACASPSEPQPPVDELLVREELSDGRMRTEPLSEPSLAYCMSGPPGKCSDANFEGASEDGAEVFFTSTQAIPGVAGAGEDAADSKDATSGCSETVEAGGCNLYEARFFPEADGEYGHELVLVSGGDSEPEGARVQGVARISEDGSLVYFVAKGVLTATPSRSGAAAQPGADNLYLYETSSRKTTFVATLAPGHAEQCGDEEDWQHRDSRPVEVSLDDRYLVLTSAADLTHEGTAPCSREVYQYDRLTGTLVRASIGQNGYNDDGRNLLYGATLPDSGGYAARDNAAAESGVVAASDGAVFFSTPDALTPTALDDQLAPAIGLPVPNIYEFRDGGISLLSDGEDAASIEGEPASKLLGFSASGADVFLATADRLIGADTDSQQDIYDAREDGGFAPPMPVVGCEGEGCAAPLTGDPSFPTPASAGQVGGEAATATPNPKTNATNKPRLTKLATALAACHKDRSRSKRARCERRTRKAFGSGKASRRVR